MSKTINTSADFEYTPPESDAYEDFAYSYETVATTHEAFKPLTAAQYERWAKLSHVSEGAVRVYHEQTGKAPKPGFRRANPLDFPGLLQLHAFHELFDASLEASIVRSRAERELNEALKKYTAAKDLEASIEKTRDLTAEAYRTLSGAHGRCQS